MKSHGDPAQLRRELMALDLATVVITRCSRELSSAGIMFAELEPHLVRTLADHIRLQPEPGAEVPR